MSLKAHKKNSCTSCAIIVSYEPDVSTLIDLLAQLNSETDFIVVDNGSSQAEAFSVPALQYQNCRDVIKLAENVGLAAALNIGIKWALENKYQYVLLFDQDSRLCEHFVGKMINAYGEAQALSKEKIAVAGPRIVSMVNGRKTKFKVFNKLFFRSNRPFHQSQTLFNTGFLITSGSLLPTSNLAEVGFMKESYFIDNIDLEWCFRASSKGFKLVGTDQAELYHDIGEKSRNPLVKTGIMVKHSPARAYYTSRNRLHLYSVKYSPFGWKVRDVVRFFLKSCWLLFFSSKRKEFWLNTLAGIRDSKTLN